MRRRDLLVSAPASALAATPPRDKPVRGAPLTANYFGPQYYDDKERRELHEVLETGRPFRWYGQGSEPPKKVLTFEQEFALRMQTRYALAVTSGTAALQCAMAALGVGPGDEVIVPAYTWHSCANAVVLAGALPVFAEIDESFNIDPDDIERHITPQTKAIMAVHLLGAPCALGRVMEIARKRNLKVIEDCAQSVGASYQGRPVGSMGDLAIYSLQLNKTITAGEGGAFVTNQPLLFERAARFHDLGGLRAPHQKLLGEARGEWFIGTNFRMNEFSGGVLLAQLRKLDTIVNALRANAARVHAGIRDLPDLKPRTAHDPKGDIGAHVFLGFPDKERRDRFLAGMKKENVPARPPSGSVILPVERQFREKITAHPAWPTWTSERGRAIRYGPEACPRTIDILNRFAGVGLDPKFSSRDCDDIAAAIRKVYQA